MSALAKRFDQPSFSSRMTHAQLDEALHGSHQMAALISQAPAAASNALQNRVSHIHDMLPTPAPR